MQFPREAKRRAQGALRRAPRIVTRRCHYSAGIIEGLPHAAEGVADVPWATQGAQALPAIDVGRRPVGEHLAQRRGEILRIRGGAVVDEDAVAVVGGAGAVVGHETVACVIATGGRPIADEDEDAVSLLKRAYGTIFYNERSSSPCCG